MNFRILYFALFIFAFQSISHAQLHLKVNGKLNLQNDTEVDSPQSGDIRWNQAANNGTGDFEGFLNGEWCSLTTKIKASCDGLIDINGLVFFADVISVPPGSYLSECNCYDGIDDDGDGLIDCADPDCGQEEFCCMPECNCEDGIDNDGDGLTDCDDSDCAQNACCTGDANYECSCNDGIDNDGDGEIDCADQESCANYLCCNLPGECDCNDGIDNDGDGDTDCNDNDCCVVLPTVCQCN